LGCRAKRKVIGQNGREREVGEGGGGVGSLAKETAVSKFPAAGGREERKMLRRNLLPALAFLPEIKK